MSGFFGSALTDRSGKFARHDDFANLKLADGDEGYDFEDTYDGLGDQLEEAGDDFNDDTFGDTTVGKDFDFSGRTANVADTLGEEQLMYERQRNLSKPVVIDRSTNSAPANRPLSNANNPWSSEAQAPSTGVWNQPTGGLNRTQYPSNSANPTTTTQSRKYQTLEEVEAAMLAASKAQTVPQQTQASAPSRGHPQMQSQGYMANAAPGITGHPQAPPGYHGPSATMMGNQGVGIPMPRQMPPGMVARPAQETSAQVPIVHSPQPEKPVVSLKEAMAEDEVTMKAQHEKNLRRAQKIGQMARYNGIMSNGDKNYVLKVQISQLVSEDPEADDFYYTVHSTLRGRSNVQQGLGHFEQTYLSRVGQSNRRGNRERQNPMLKMQQQVQKIIASAKSRPKSTSLAMEGSLGKLSFSRVRQPKQVMNIKMPEGSAPIKKQSKKEALQNIESVYNTMLILEQTGRSEPHERGSAEHAAWTDRMSQLSNSIWHALHVMDQVDDSQLHPFIQLLQYSKGKKLIPRLYRHLSHERRLTMMTMIVAHLDMLDVVRLARYDESGTLPRSIREEIELFTQTVLPPLLVFASGAPMKIVVGLLNMLLERNNIHLICMSKVGLSFMTMFISRAEIAKQAEQVDESEVAAWHAEYNHMFGMMEGKFAIIFPPASHHADEIYPWQFLAACAVSASPEQQHALVNEARDRVLDNVQSTKGLPQDIADIKRSNVNLFLNAIGLDASQLEG